MQAHVDSRKRARFGPYIALTLAVVALAGAALHRFSQPAAPRFQLALEAFAVDSRWRAGSTNPADPLADPAAIPTWVDRARLTLSEAAIAARSADDRRPEHLTVTAPIPNVDLPMVGMDTTELAGHPSALAFFQQGESRALVMILDGSAQGLLGDHGPRLLDEWKHYEFSDDTRYLAAWRRGDNIFAMVCDLHLATWRRRGGLDALAGFFADVTPTQSWIPHPTVGQTRQHQEGRTRLPEDYFRPPARQEGPEPATRPAGSADPGIAPPPAE